MTGDIADIVARIKSVLPQAWFGDSTPVLDAVLSGIAFAWSACYAQIQSVRNQTRLSTASDIGLDLFALDYFGSSVARGGMSDDAFRAQIQSNLLRPRGTRSALITALNDLTGRAPAIFEPARPGDTGAYASAGSAAYLLAYNQAGGWGSLQMPFQAMIVAYRPRESGIPLVSGWGGTAGGYGVGTIEYANPAMSQGQVADSAIQSAIACAMPIGTTAWMQTSN